MKYPDGSEIPKELPPAYRLATTEEKRCDTCRYYKDGYCSYWGAPVRPEYLCNAWAAVRS